jgi:hypothetical protein
MGCVSSRSNECSAQVRQHDEICACLPAADEAMIEERYVCSS